MSEDCLLTVRSILASVKRRLWGNSLKWKFNKKKRFTGRIHQAEHYSADEKLRSLGGKHHSSRSDSNAGQPKSSTLPLSQSNTTRTKTHLLPSS
ncbi:hypothetical protein ScPMuIL_017290 [Solemya velum]